MRYKNNSVLDKVSYIIAIVKMLFTNLKFSLSLHIFLILKLVFDGFQCQML